MHIFHKVHPSHTLSILGEQEIELPDKNPGVLDDLCSNCGNDRGGCAVRATLTSNNGVGEQVKQTTPGYNNNPAALQEMWVSGYIQDAIHQHLGNHHSR